MTNKRLFILFSLFSVLCVNVAAQTVNINIGPASFLGEKDHDKGARLAASYYHPIANHLDAAAQLSIEGRQLGAESFYTYKIAPMENRSRAELGVSGYYELIDRLNLRLSLMLGVEYMQTNGVTSAYGTDGNIVELGYRDTFKPCFDMSLNVNCRIVDAFYLGVFLNCRDNNGLYLNDLHYCYGLSMGFRL